MLASSARRSGAPSSAAPASTSSGSRPASTRSALGAKVTVGARDRRRRRGHRRQRRHATTYDAVVIATHPDQALAMLAEPTAAQREVLGAMPYSTNTALLHTDDLACCRGPRAARASWNFLRRGRRRPRRGHGHLRPDPAAAARRPDTHYLVTLGGEDLVDPAHRHRPDGVRAPALHARLGRRPAPAARAQHRRGSPSPAPTTAGASTRTARAPASCRRRREAARRRPGRGRGAALARLGGGTAHLRDDDPAHPAHAVPRTLRPPLPHLAGRPRRPAATTAARRWPVRGPRPPRRPRPRRCARTSTRSSPTHGIDLHGGRIADGWRNAARASATASTRSASSGASTATARSAASSSRCTTPTATGTPTSSTRTSTAGRATTRSSTSRRSTAPTAPTTSPSRVPGEPLARGGHPAHRRRRPRSARPWSATPGAPRSAPSCAPPRRAPLAPLPSWPGSSATASGSGCAACRSSPDPPTTDRRLSHDHDPDPPTGPRPRPPASTPWPDLARAPPRPQPTVARRASRGAVRRPPSTARRSRVERADGTATVRAAAARSMMLHRPERVLRPARRATA